MPETPEFYTPAIFNDQPLTADTRCFFQFDDYARTLARVIASTGTRTPLTIGINGAWGTGKTTLMRRVRHYLDQGDGEDRPSFVHASEKWPDPDAYRRVRTVWFNAWKYSRQESLFVALTTEVLREMRTSDLASKLAANFAKVMEPRVRLPEATIDAFVKFLTMGAVDPNTPLYTDESPFKMNRAFLDEFTELFDQLVRRWVYRDWGKDKDTAPEEIDDTRGVLAIFVDDLDRCMPDKAIQVLESIKLLMDRSGLVFVLGASCDLVELAVRKHYASLDLPERDVRRESENYLEKIIQVRFDLPPLQAEGEQSLGVFLDGLVIGKSRLADTSPTLVEHLKRLARAGTITPRRVKTFINYAELQWAVLRTTGKAADRGNLNMWMVLTEAGGPVFRDWIENLPENERPERIQNGIAYARAKDEPEQGEEVLADPYLKKMLDDNQRLRRVLEDLDSFDVTPEELHLYIHLCAPAVKERPAVIRSSSQPRLFQMDEFVRVPAGAFLMGSAPEDEMAQDRETPQFSYTIPYDYRIGRYPVMNVEYDRFVETGGTAGPIGFSEALAGKPHHPVINVSWRDAVTYCEWLTGNLRGRGLIGEREVVRLPSEAEWEKAARAEHGRRWPWGDEWRKHHCNSAEEGVGGTTEVGRYSPQGDSFYGAADMAGNVWEWTRTKLTKNYEGYERAEDNDPDAGGSRVVRGGSFDGIQRLCRCAYRYWLGPVGFDLSQGFRVVVAPVDSEL